VASASKRLERPAFYALRPGGWRDLVTLLHPPYTVWNLANVAIGAALAPHLYAGRLAAALAAFFSAVGVRAHVRSPCGRTRIAAVGAAGGTAGGASGLRWPVGRIQGRCRRSSAGRARPW